MKKFEEEAAVNKIVFDMSSRDSDPAAKVYVGDLGSGGSKPDIEREFEKFGALKSVWVARNPPGNFRSAVVVSWALGGEDTCLYRTIWTICSVIKCLSTYN